MDSDTPVVTDWDPKTLGRLEFTRWRYQHLRLSEYPIGGISTIKAHFRSTKEDLSNGREGRKRRKP
jgi:allantoicase